MTTQLKNIMEELENLREWERAETEARNRIFLMNLALPVFLKDKVEVKKL